MIDLDALYRRLEAASFSQREEIAGEVVSGTPRDELAPLVRGLGHPQLAVRLGVVEILRRARYREALRKLLAHALAHDGDDRVFAVRAIAQLAASGDTFLVAHARTWAASSDAYLAPHGQKLLALLAPHTLERLVVDLFAAEQNSERRALVAQIEARGPQALAAAAKLVLAKGNQHLVAYIARAMIRNAAAIPAALVPLLEAARRRLADVPIATEALDEAMHTMRKRPQQAPK